MLCSQSSCCLSQLEGEDVGACTAHAATCGAGVGMFLRLISHTAHFTLVELYFKPRISLSFGFTFFFLTESHFV